MMATNNTSGERIRNRRIELGYSVEEVAAKLGKNRATIYRYENNDIENMPLSVIGPLADVLKVTPAYIIGWENEKAPVSTDEGENGRIKTIIELASNLPDKDLDEVISLIQWKLSKSKQ